ncbi:MAG: efflux RND transporter periplasmic adaptor subunit [Spirochaetes bacterium]|nr:efflux RND transporter periplasmic adaptor subunit [Spirochaetota bacterium]
MVLSIVYGIISLFIKKTNVPDTQPIIEIETMTITPQTITKILPAVGSIQYKDKAIISSKVFGRIEKIYTEQGTIVKKGQILAKIETYPLELQLMEAQAELEKAKANHRLAEEKLIQSQRTVEQRLKAIVKAKLELTDKYVTLKNTEDVLKKKEQLFKAGGITQTELNSLKTNYHTVKTQFLQARKDYETLVVGYRDSDIKKAGFVIPSSDEEKNKLLIKINTAIEQAECDAAKSQVQQVTTQIEIIKTNIKEATIVSPINGIVAIRSIDIGEKVSEDTNLFVIINTAQVYCIVQMNEKDLPMIKQGQNVELAIDALGSKKIHGRVFLISPIIDPSSRTAEVKILCSNSSNELKPGMFARASINIGAIPDAILIPLSSIKEGEKPAVFCIRNTMAFETPITILEHINEQYALVKTGLSAGDMIAISHIKLLYDKAKVKPISMQSQRSGGNNES